jgi:MFS family permease
MSAAALAAPLTMALLVGDGGNLSQLYFIAGIVGVIFILAVIVAFRHFYDAPYLPLKIRGAVSHIMAKRNLRGVVMAHFLLQIFFTWAIVYIPLFLVNEAKLPWDSIGIIIAAGLAAFVIFEFPIGILADKYWGEVEMMAVGFVILAISVGGIAAMAGASVLAWMVLMFTSRLGASLVEVTTESYFFKQVRGEDASLMTVFRLTRPTANLVGALLGSACLLFLPFAMAFVVLGLILACGVFITSTLTDTR